VAFLVMMCRPRPSGALADRAPRAAAVVDLIRALLEVVRASWRQSIAKRGQTPGGSAAIKVS